MDSADFDELEAAARAKLPEGAYVFAAAGADDEITTQDNIDAWRRLRLRPRVLHDVTKVDTTVGLLGSKVAMPILVAPSGRHRLFHPQGEAATARGAASANAVYTLATSSTVSIEDVAAQRGSAPQWFQLYMPPDRSVTEGLLDRLAAAGFRAVVFTVDQPVYGSSPRSVRTPVVPNPDIRHMNLPGQPMARVAYDPVHNGVVNFPTALKDLEWLVKRAPFDVIVKGVLRGDDARRCVDAGAKAIIVSNHGGRHLDAAIATADALPDVVSALNGQAEIYVDGGIRRGTDIVKALALGAKAVLIGRPVLWGLAMGGAEGVQGVLAHLQTELVRSMQLCGVSSLAGLTPDLVAPSRF